MHNITQAARGSALVDGPDELTLRLLQERTSALEVGPRLYLTSLAISINTAKPCPTDKWNEIKDAKHERKEARTKEAKQMKAAGTWGPSLGIPVKWDEKQLQKQDVRRRKVEVVNSLDNRDPSTCKDA